jgi:hypothetical protein
MKAGWETRAAGDQRRTFTSMSLSVGSGRLGVILFVILFCSLTLLAGENVPSDTDAQQRVSSSRTSAAHESANLDRKELLNRLTDLVSRSGRATAAMENPSERLTSPSLTPGSPPLISFRYFEGKQRHRYGNLDLVMDDAGH